MKILDRPGVEPVADGEPATGTATLYHTADFAPSRFGGILTDLGIVPRLMGDPAAVDVAQPHVFLLPARALLKPRLAEAISQLHGDLSTVIVTGGGPTDSSCLPARVRDIVFAWLDEPLGEDALHFALRTSLRQIELLRSARQALQDLDQRSEQMAVLNQVGIALSGERDMDALQHLILQRARELTSADAGSLYLVVEDEQPALDEQGQPANDSEGNPLSRRVKVLAFNKTQNYSNPSDFTAFKLPLTTGSISGYVATTGQVVQHEDMYHLSDGLPYSFNVDFDKRSGYRTKSMLTVPMVNMEKEIIGAIQLINRKRNAEAKLTLESAEEEVLPFSDEDRDLALSFASQAAVALDNKRLMDSIQTLFEGFVTASVQAIESRDPTTSGHSGRVAILTVGLAEVVNQVEAGRFRDTYYRYEDLKEIRYASLLHDFGKVGVREHVLVKAKKLYDWQIQQIHGRFGVAQAALEARFLRRKLDYLTRYGNAAGWEDALEGIDRDYANEVEQLQQYWQVIKQVNEPTVLEDNSFALLTAISSLTYETPESGSEPLVESAELQKLSIKKGSLDDNERLEIESHVTHTYKFLTKIPWTKELQHVPEVAWAHHEKLDGSGYPNGLTSEQIPLQSKMMTIADIYDALTAWDRPYKKAVPVDKALQILGWEVKDGHVDADLLELFIQNQVYERTARPA
ncbi:MAG TPA: HD domain-containing phosphohydrolase [Chloroflexota bacterium]|nr:HD domain-containing phosphohydrolase [Chloroflexota bacterium]